METTGALNVHAPAPPAGGGAEARFAPGALVVYGGVGVCRVEAVGRPATSVADRRRQYYTLRPFCGTETIYAPVDTPVPMRAVMTRAEAKAFIRHIPSVPGEVYHNRNLTMLAAHYDAFFHSGSRNALLSLIRGVYTKSCDAAANGRRVGEIDQRYRARAENLLHSELAAALEIPLAEVPGYISRALAGDGE